MKIQCTFLILVFLLLMISCSSINVVSDYDTKVDFTKFKTFAFYKEGIDKAPISDLDKKRIMRAIQMELKAKGMEISQNPDILVSVFTKAREQLSLNNNFQGIYGGFYYPWYYGGAVNVSRYTEGTLFVDFLAVKDKSLVWQGIGTGVLTNRSPEDKIKSINDFVTHILGQYPPK